MSPKMLQKIFSIFVLTGMIFSLVAPLPVAAAPLAETPAQTIAGTSIEVEPALEQQFKQEGSAGYLIYFREKADLSAADKLDWEARGWYVMEALKATAANSQSKVQAYLDAQGVNYQSFWIDNIIAVDASTYEVFNGLMAFSEIESLRARRTMGIIEPDIVPAPESTFAIEPNISHVKADQVWALGYEGTGVTIANIDTGVRYTHQALVNQYRGNLGGSFDHNYNWWDPYGNHPASPADDNGHGTHTMGTMVGDDGGANQIGMAPDANWIACRGCNTSSCTDTALLGCAQFMAAPTDLNGANADPSKRPIAVNNSWGDCGQSYDNWYQGVVDAWHAAGIHPIFSNGNASNCGYSAPPGLNTVGNPARYGNVTGVGSSGQSNGQYATHSNWGPTDNPDTVNPNPPDAFGAVLKPQVIAPGVNIRSSVNTGDTAYQGGWTGTSMSAPHVTGLIALMVQAAPCLAGDYATVETILEETAIPVPYASGGTPPPPAGNEINYASGHGEIDALAAVQMAMGMCGDSTLSGQVTESTLLTAPGDPIAGALVVAENISTTRQTTTDAMGYYSMTLFAGTYDVTISKYGYVLQTIPGVNVSGATTLNVPLPAANMYTVDGTVTDVNTGWPLYAKITIDGYPGDPIWTDPATGMYSITLAEGFTYTMQVDAWLDGYPTVEQVVAPLTGNATIDFALDVDVIACAAPGYGSGSVPLLEDSFDTITAFPAEGWDVVDTSGTAGNWATSATTVHPSGQPPHSGAKLAYFNSWTASSGNATRLYRTAGVDLSASSGVAVSLWMYHDSGYSSSNDRVQVQVSTDGGTTWTDVGAPISRYDGSIGWKKHLVSLDAYTGPGYTDVRLGLNAISAFGNDIHIDDVAISEIGCAAPLDGGLVIGQVNDLNTGDPLTGAEVMNDGGYSTDTAATEDTAVGDSFYTLFSRSGSHVFTATFPMRADGYATVNVVDGGVVVQDFQLGAGQLSADPAAVAVTLELGATDSTSFDLNNTGTGAASFEIVEKAVRSSAVTAGEDVLVVAYDTTAAASMVSALTGAGYTALSVSDATFQTYTVPQLLEYSAVFYAGSSSANARTLLMAYLDAGGSLYISDNDLGYFNGSTTFYQTYLQATYGGDNGGDFLTGEDIMLGLDLNVSTDPYPDYFTVGAEGTRIFSYTGGSNAGGVAVNRNGYLAIYTAFDFDDMAANSDEVALVERIMGYLATSDITWLMASPVTGTIAAPGTAIINVGFDASVAEVPAPGTYLAKFEVKNDTPYGKLVIPVTMTVTAPADWGYLSGVVTSTGYCDAEMLYVEGADVLIEGQGGFSMTLTTDAMGEYAAWLDSDYSPYTVTVSKADFSTETAIVTIVGSDTPTQDFTMRWLKPCVGVTPDSLSAEIVLGESDSLSLTISNLGAIDLDFEIKEQDGGFAPWLHAAVKSTAPVVGHPELAETGVPAESPLLGKASGGPAPEDIGTAWETMAPLPSARVFAAVVADTDGYIYVIGGTSDGGATIPTDTVYRYNTASNTWDTMAPLPMATDSIDAIEINGKIYVPGNADTADTFVYDIASNTWSTITANGGYSARSQYQVAAIDNKLYVLGGIVAAASASTTEVWVLDTTSGTWSAGVPMQKSRTSFSAGAIDGVIYVAGGVLFPGFVPDMTAEKFDGTTWSYIAGVPNGGGTYTRWSYNADAVGENGLWLGAGRRDAGWAVLNHAGYYDPTTDTWTDSPTIPVMSQGRVYMEGDVATDGYFYVIGGRDGAASIAYATNERLYVGYAGAPADVPWLSTDVITGTVAPDGGMAEVAVMLDSALVAQPGEYYATLKVKSNDPMYANVSIPVTMTVLGGADFGQLQGTVTSLGYCDANPMPVDGAQVVVMGAMGTYTLTTDANGFYNLWLDQAQSPLSVSITADNHTAFYQDGVVVTAQQTTTVNADLRWMVPCVSAMPESFEVTLGEGAVVSYPLSLFNDGAGAAMFEIGEMPGTPLRVIDAATPIETVGTPRQITIGDLSLSSSGKSGGVSATPALPKAMPNALTITHSASQTIIQLNSVSCNAGGVHADNSYLRVFTLTDFGIETGFHVTSVDVGIENAAGVGGSQPAEVYLYTLDGALAWANMTEIGSAMVDVADQALTVLNIPVEADVPADAVLVVEFFTPDASGVGHSLFVGSNNLGQTAPTYLAAADCGIIEPTDLAAIGFPGMHLVMNVTGELINTDVPWLSAAPVTGTIPADDMAEVMVTFDTMTYTVGTYTATLKVMSDDPMYDEIEIPVTLNIEAANYAMAMSHPEDGMAMPGDVMTYTMYLTNTGNMPDTYTITVGTSTWTAQTDHTVVGPLMPGEMAMFHLMVEVPADAMGGEQGMTEIMVTSHGLPTMHQTVTVTTTALAMYGVEISADSGMGGAPGETIEYTVYLTNTGNTTDTFDLTLSGNAWATVVTPTMVTLPAGDHASATVMVTIAPTAMVNETDTVVVTATSQGDDTVSASVDVTTTATIYKIFLPLIRR